MAVVDIQNRTVTLKIVYYGCAMGGKTTNLITLHRLTDPDNSHGLVSIATKDDRTLFFDLLPMELGQVGGLKVKVKAYTVPGQVHYETTRRQVLGGADGVVHVVDSNPEVSQANSWSLDNLRLNIKANGLDPRTTPVVLQWNKRDLPNARSVAELESELNPGGLPTLESVATTGVGVVETFAEVVKLAIAQTYAKSGRTSITREAIGKTVDEALAQARVAQPPPAVEAEPAFNHRFDMDAYRDQQAEQGRDKRIVDEESLLSEAVSTNMKLAEQLDEYREAQGLSDRRSLMMKALGHLAPLLADPASAALPQGAMAQLLEGAGRKRGSLLLFAPGKDVMQEREIVPEGRDPLNSAVAAGLGSAAHRMCQTSSVRVVEDLTTEVFFDAIPPGAEGLAGALIAPLNCDGLAFGALVAYSLISEPQLDGAEHEYWSTAATLIGLSLHWRALRQKLSQVKTT